MKDIRKALIVGSIMLGLVLFGCSKKTKKNTTKNTTSNTTIVKTNTEKQTTTIPVERVTVNFDSDGGSDISSQSIVKGSLATKPDDPTREGYTFGGWYNGETLWDFSSSKVENKMTLKAKWKPYVRNGNKIYFGYYPQTLEDEYTNVSKLNELVGTPNEPKEGYTWVDYGYYNDYDSYDKYMFYIDLDTDNDGKYDYRGVYFTTYRPYSIFRPASATYQDDNGFTTNTSYWFKYEKIEWDILDEKDDEVLLISNLILDAQEFYSSRATHSFEHNGGTGYANNYALSSIRKWLNETFYDTAFNDLQKELIKETTVDNSLDSNIYACENTNDMVFLLSDGETNNTNFFKDADARIAVGSDYSKVQGVEVYDDYYTEYIGNSNWLLRTPISSEATRDCYINFAGGAGSGMCYSCSEGIRPCLVIKL